MTAWTSIKQCAEGAGVGATAGAVVTGPFGAIGGSVGGCLLAQDDPAATIRAASRGLASAWRAVTGLFDEPSANAAVQPPELEGALLRTAGHLEHRRRWHLEVCRQEGGRKPTGADYLAGRCTRWSTVPGFTAWVWHERNRRALLGPPGAASDPDLLYKGLAVEYARARQAGDRSTPEETLLRAVARYGAFLALRYPGGQRDERNGAIEHWGAPRRPTAFVTVEPDPEPSSPSLGLGLAALAAVAAVGGGALLLGATR